MKLNTIRIPCINLAASEAHYSDVLGWRKIFGSSEHGYVGYQLDNVAVLLELEETGEFESGRYLGFSVSVANLQDYYLLGLQRGVEFTGPPEKQPWGGTMTHIRDCNGNTFSIVEDANG